MSILSWKKIVAVNSSKCLALLYWKIQGIVLWSAILDIFIKRYLASVDPLFQLIAQIMRLALSVAHGNKGFHEVPDSCEWKSPLCRIAPMR